MLLQSTSDLEITSWQTSLTPKTLVSGFRTSDNSDPSLLPQIIGKTLVIEDFTGIMNLSASDQDEIYGVLRSAYNGRYEKPFGHVGRRVYPDPSSSHETCHFTILAGVTGAIHADRRANHGERFLKYHMMADGEDYDPVAQIEAAMKNTIDQVSPEEKLRPPVSAFIEPRMEQIEDCAGEIPIPNISDQIKRRIIGLGQIIAIVRAVVLRKSGELLLRPEAEIGTRISQQLIKFSQSVAFTLDKTEVDEECYHLTKRIGLDTCYGWHRDVLMAVAHHGKTGTLRTEVCKHAIMASSTAHRCLEDLFELGAVEFEEEPVESSVRGKRPQRWFLTDLLTKLFELADIRSIPLPTNKTIDKLIGGQPKRSPTPPKKKPTKKPKATTVKA